MFSWSGICASRVLMALWYPEQRVLAQPAPSSSGLSPAPAPFLLAKASPLPGRERMQCLPPARFEPRGSIVLNVPPPRRRGLLSTLGRRAKCKATGLLTGAGYRLDPERGEHRTVAADSPFPFTRAGTIKVGRLRQAQSIAKQRAQEERKSSAPLAGTYHELERVVRAGCQVVSRPRSLNVSLKEVGELHGIP